MLSDANKEVAIRAMNEYLNAPASLESGLTPVIEAQQLDADRQRVIAEIRGPL
jgi:hypothetical protein